MTIFPKVYNLMQSNGLDNVLLTGGGIISSQDMKKLKKLGVGQLFGPGTPIQDTIDYITHWVKNNI